MPAVYARKARSEFNWLLHLVIPVLGIAAFLPAWFTAMGIGGSVLKFVGHWPTRPVRPGSLSGSGT